MTTPTPKPTVPTSAEALRLAFDIVRTPCSAAESQRAEILLGIAREIREDRQFRDTRSFLAPLAAPKTPEPEPLPDLATGGVIPRKPPGKYDLTFDRENAAARAVRLLRKIAAEVQWPEPAPETQVAIDPSVTQQMPIVWAIGDLSTCRHCRTPIELQPATIQQQQAFGEAGDDRVWRHKYTGQAVCASPVLVQGDDEVPSGHTFAEPEPR